MNRILGFALLMIASAGFVFGSSVAPEIDPSYGGSALALLSGALLVVRGRRKR
jgi:hypothetical protein